MKILHLVTSVFNAGGGTSEIIPKMCSILVQCGEQVRLLTGVFGKPSESAAKAAEEGVDVRYCNLIHRPFIGLGLSKQFRAELIEGVKWADVVHIHGHWQELNWIAPIVARHYNTPYIMQPHGFLEQERLKKSRLKKIIVGSVLERPNLNRASCVVATAESEMIGIKAFGVRSPIRVAPLGIDASLYDRGRSNPELLNRIGLDGSKKTILYFSRIAPIKGLDMLAVAWSRLCKVHKGWQLCIVGPGDEEYVRRIKLLFNTMINNGSVFFSGPLYGQDKLDLFKSVNAFVLPTKSENFGIAVQEALASGLPVVCTKGAPWSAIEDFGAGYWVDISADGIAKGLADIMELGKAERDSMAKNGRKLVENNFSWHFVSQQMIDVYKEVLHSVCEI